jgi:adenylate cyclase, class 2
VSIEIEKKYRLTRERAETLVSRLDEIGAERSDSEFEVNTLYTSPSLDLEGAILRLRVTNKRAILTFKKRFSSPSSIKRQLEEETEVEDGDAMARILDRLGFKPSLIYEKRRDTWQHHSTEIAIDELPFGWFMEIEGEEADIVAVERAIGIDESSAEEATYPALTRKFGRLVDDRFEARF